MPSAHLTLREEDVVRLTLEFLYNRELHISQLSVERETGVINGIYSDDVLFLRQLILDGQWDDVLEFIQPLEAIETFDMRQFHYVILKHKYVELLCIKSEAGPVPNVDNAVEEVVKVLNELEKFAPSKDEHSNLCLLLTLPRLSDHLQYKDWNPSNARVQCFREVFPLVEKFLPGDKKQGEANLMAKNDRLIQLIIKGILYESCVNYCQQKATTGSKEHSEMNFSKLLNGTGFSDSDLSLLSWLQSIPPETFSCPFEQRTLNVDVERLEKPSLETSWTEHMLVTPIKPKTFPHSAMPFTRPRSADIMSRSLIPALDGLPFGLGQSRNAMALSTGDLNSMSRSFASFHLTGKKMMNTSVDRLFENEDNVFLSSYGDLPAIMEKTDTPRPPPRRARSRSPEKKDGSVRGSAASTPEHRGRDSPASSNSSSKTSRIPPDSPRSSRRDSLSDKCTPAASVVLPPNEYASGSDGDLMKEFQRQKQRLMETLHTKEREREELIRSLQADNRIAEENALARQPVPNQVNSVGAKAAVAGGNPGSVVVRTNNPGASLPGPGGGAIRTGPAGMGGAPTVSGMNGISDGRGQVPPVFHGDSTNEIGMQDGRFDAVKTSAQPTQNGAGKPRFVAVTTLEDVQAVRCAEFHPQGKLYAVGSNSKTLRICSYPKLADLREDHTTYQPTVLFKRTKHHKGSIYCLAWSPMGDLMATGSNDKTVKLMHFNAETSNLEGQEIELTMHDGTVRDLCFLEDVSNKSSLLISGGAGDCKIYVTDCTTGTPFQALSGHSGHVLTLYNWGGAMFVSGSQDKTVRFWDLRTRGCVNMVTPATAPGNRGSPVAAVCVDPSGRLLVSGHEDSSCVLYDIRGGRNVSCFKPHSADIRSIRFSPSAYYLLTGGYDNKLVLTDLQGDLTMPLPSVVVAHHQDKVISGRWHPTEFSFLSTSADKMSTLWALPPV